MLSLVSLDDCYAQLQIDDVTSNGSAHDPWLNVWIPAVSALVAQWLKDDWRLWIPELDVEGNAVIDSSGDPIPLIDSSGGPTAQPNVRAAVLLEIASQFRFREGDGDNVVPADAGYGYTLSKGATALLGALRKSTVV